MVNDNGLVNCCASRQRAHTRQMMKKKKKSQRRARFTGPKLALLSGFILSLF